LNLPLEREGSVVTLSVENGLSERKFFTGGCRVRAARSPSWRPTYACVVI
jgi:hypothetical protein